MDVSLLLEKLSRCKVESEALDLLVDFAREWKSKSVSEDDVIKTSESLKAHLENMSFETAVLCLEAMEEAAKELKRLNYEALKNQEDKIKLFNHNFYKIGTETDRGAIIVAHCIIDEYLRYIIRDSLPIQALNKKDELFDSKYAPLESLGAKKELSYRLGLISEEVYRALGIFNRIRNDFAHNMSFESIEKDAKNQVVECIRINPKLNSRLKRVWKNYRDPLHNNSARELFNGAFAILSIQILEDYKSNPLGIASKKG